ncbi:hypothetical protein [Tahibacter amnicola]|uniref:Uncharacterized protein n=1 Tax=Tahibacter amnicola TaxID=2976241 RepID=A0ABY6BA83_9GAMM|nr:hypothetical protein [Tahibacter amnicola]UXI66765.1 hypothetical protein N4264_18700 [Tahibacter amnicola]
MGLDAFVRCNCIPRDVVVPEPFRPYAHWDDYDDKLAIDCLAPAVDHAMVQAFVEWLATKCPHEDRDLATAGWSWGGVGAFRAALQHVGTDRFPTLATEIPDTNGGRTDAAAARRIQEEIRAFEQVKIICDRYLLVDSDTQEEIWESSGSAGRVILVTPSANAGVDQNGYFVTRDGQVVFQSRRFVHIPYPAWRIDKRGHALVRDIGTGVTYRNSPIIQSHPKPWPNGRLQDTKGRFNQRTPRYVHLERRPQSAAEFTYFTDDLKRLCSAAIETGNPIQWC